MTPTSSNTGNSSASADYGDYDYIQGSSLRLNSETCYDAFTLMCTGKENGFDSSCLKDSEGDDSDISKVEDLEVRMDLTDDLLHMVCYWMIIILLLVDFFFKIN